MIRNKLVEFQKERLTQARHHRMWSMSDLAERIAVSRQAISSFENGDKKPSPETLRELARTLDVPESFLTLQIRDGEGNIESLVSFRSLAASTNKARNQAKAYLDWASSIIAFVSNYIELPKPSLPIFEIDNFESLSGDDIEEYAERTRRHFGLGDGPISDMTLLLENNGVVVLYLPIQSEVDGLSAWIDGRPYILVNQKFNAFRRRFDLGHELAHLVLHKYVTNEDIQQTGVLKKIENGAHRFSGAFVAPEKSFSKEVYGIDLESIKQLKERWGISIQSLIMRLHNLGLISDSQKVRLFQRISSAGMRTREPLDDQTPVERARLVQRVFEFLNERDALSFSDIVMETNLPEYFIEWVTGFTKEKLSAPQIENVVQFKQRI